MLIFAASQAQKVFQPHETEHFMRLFRFGLVALDIYRVTTLPNGSHVLRSAKSVVVSVAAMFVRCGPCLCI